MRDTRMGYLAAFGAGVVVASIAAWNLQAVPAPVLETAALSALAVNEPPVPAAGVASSAVVVEGAASVAAPPKRSAINNAGYASSKSKSKAVVAPSPIPSKFPDARNFCPELAEPKGESRFNEVTTEAMRKAALSGDATAIDAALSEQREGAPCFWAKFTGLGKDLTEPMQYCTHDPAVSRVALSSLSLLSLSLCVCLCVCVCTVCVCPSPRARRAVCVPCVDRVASFAACVVRLTGASARRSMTPARGSRRTRTAR
jgi:hypothetical protein